VAKWIERVPVALPGLVIYGLLWLAVLLRFNYASAATESIDTLWQSLGSEYLLADPLSSLSALHIQPWGVNALYAIDLFFTPTSHTLLLVVFGLAGAGSVALLGATLVRAGLPRSWAMVSSVILAALPGTVLYSFWPYNVTLISFLVVVAAWGLALMRTRPISGAFVSASAVLGLQLLRSTFVWVFVLVWCIFLLVLLLRSFSGRQFIIAALPVFVVAGISIGSQAYYFINYNLPAMSSWSGQNIAKALLVSDQLNVTDSARSEISEDACLASLLVAYETQKLNVWDPGGLVQLSGCEDLVVEPVSGVDAWDQDFRSDGVMNFNSRLALAASGEWTRMMSIIVRNDPTQLVRMAVTSGAGPRSSAIGIYLDPSDEYPWIDEQRSVMPLVAFSGLLSLVFAPALIVLVFLGIGQAVLARDSFLRRNILYWAILGVVAFHAAASTMAEYAENMRFRAEIDPLLLLLGVMSLYAISRGSRARTQDTKIFNIVMYEIVRLRCWTQWCKLQVNRSAFTSQSCLVGSETGIGEQPMMTDTYVRT